MALRLLLRQDTANLSIERLSIYRVFFSLLGKIDYWWGHYALLQYINGLSFLLA